MSRQLPRPGRLTMSPVICRTMSPVMTLVMTSRDDLGGLRCLRWRRPAPMPPDLVAEGKPPRKQETKPQAPRLSASVSSRTLTDFAPEGRYGKKQNCSGRFLSCSFTDRKKHREENYKTKSRAKLLSQNRARRNRLKRSRLQRNRLKRSRLKRSRAKRKSPLPSQAALS